jgi:uncharacterized protein YbbK (DUF523 family)
MAHNEEIVLVSACLVGLNTRYDGGSKAHPEVVKLLKQGRALPVCPEQLGGLSTPRPKAEITEGDGEDVLEGRARVLTEDGQDVTEAFIKGAKECMKLARMASVTKAILKERSPSCGVNWIVRGGAHQQGTGVMAALLKKNGVRLISSDTL